MGSRLPEQSKIRAKALGSANFTRAARVLAGATHARPTWNCQVFRQRRPCVPRSNCGHTCVREEEGPPARSAAWSTRPNGARVQDEIVDKMLRDLRHESGARRRMMGRACGVRNRGPALVGAALTAATVDTAQSAWGGVAPIVDRGAIRGPLERPCVQPSFFLPASTGCNKSTRKSVQMPHPDLITQTPARPRSATRHGAARSRAAPSAPRPRRPGCGSSRAGGRVHG